MSKGDHILIAGGGRVGRRVAERFAARGDDVSVVEKDPDGVESEVEDSFEIISGDATHPSVLSEVLQDETTVVAALTNRGDTNLAICMVAKELDPDLRTVARIEQEDGDEYGEFVDQIYFPERASIKAAVNAVSGSDIRTLEGVTGDLEVLDIRVGYDAPIKGKRLADIEFPEGVQVISRTGGHVAAQAGEKMVAGRRYLVAADNPVVDEVVEMFEGSSSN